MNLQYITDSQGQTTGVYIPIQEWQELLSRFNLTSEEIEIPDWHKEVVRERIEEYRQNPASGLDFDQTMDEIEKGLYD